MIEQRKLSQEELDRLIAEAPESEKRGILGLCSHMNMTPSEIFKRYAFDWDGVVSDGRPIYVAGVFSNGKIYELWTIVNSDVKEQISLYRCAKRGLKRWVEAVGLIHATMMKSWVKNIAWTERLGFKPCHETADTITFVIIIGLSYGMFGSR